MPLSTDLVRAQRLPGADSGSSYSSKELVKQYEAANYYASEAFKAYEEYVEAGRFALADDSERDFRTAHHVFEQATAALVDARRHREEELRCRKLEINLYEYLDDYWTGKNLSLAADYCARRIVRLRTLFEVTLAQASIALLDHQITQVPHKIMVCERLIINEDLENRTKLEGHRQRSFGSAWGNQDGGYSKRVHPSEAGQRLNELRWEIKRLHRSVPKWREQRKESEMHWARLRREIEQQNRLWKPLDEAARRHHAGLDPVEHSSESRMEASNQASSSTTLNASQSLNSTGRAVRALGSSQITASGGEDQGWRSTAQHQREDSTLQSGANDDDEANRWEQEYAAALENEDNNATPVYRQKASTQLNDTTELYANLDLNRASVGNTQNQTPSRPSDPHSTVQDQGWGNGAQYSQSPLIDLTSNGWYKENVGEVRYSSSEAWESSWPTKEVKLERMEEQITW